MYYTPCSILLETIKIVRFMILFLCDISRFLSWFNMPFNVYFPQIFSSQFVPYHSSRSNFYLFSQVMDERWESEVIEYGAINITGFRIIDTNKRYVREFLEGWKKLDPTTSQGAGKELISVSLFIKRRYSVLSSYENLLLLILYIMMMVTFNIS